MSELIYELSDRKMKLDRTEGGEGKRRTKLERYFKQFIDGILRSYLIKGYISCMQCATFTLTIVIQVRSTYYSNREGRGRGYVRRWREKPREKRGEGKGREDE